MEGRSSSMKRNTRSGGSVNTNKKNIISWSKYDQRRTYRPDEGAGSKYVIDNTDFDRQPPHFESPTSPKALSKKDAKELSNHRRLFKQTFTTREYLLQQIWDVLDTYTNTPYESDEAKYNALRVRDSRLLKYARDAQESNFADIVQYVQQAI